MTRPLLDRQITGVGTPVSTWSASRQWRDLQVVDPVAELGPKRRLVVVAPHPDDEVLAAGGLLQLCAQAGLEVAVIAVTDGGASHPGSTRWPAETLTATRQRESEAALDVLGVSARDVTRLAVADGQVSANVGRLGSMIFELLRPDDLVVAPWRWDGHPDHEAVSAACVGAVWVAGAELWRAPIWGWHWAMPDNPYFDWPNAIAVALPDKTAALKAEAVQAFTSQLQSDDSTGAEPIVPEWALRRLVHDREVFFRG